MALIVNSAEGFEGLDSYQSLQFYNALDCCVTVEVWQKRQSHFTSDTLRTYLNEKDIQAPTLEMQLRGIRMDELRTWEECQLLLGEIKQLEAYFSDLSLAAYGKHVNWKSPQQLKSMLNGLGFTCRDTERDTLEKLKAHFWAEPIVLTILALRDKTKLYDVLAKSKRNRDHRFHAAFKVPGTTTGRLSSAKDPFGEGHNLQNINERPRRCFIPDLGMKFCYIDLEQAESRGVAYLSGDEAYIQACESGDLHTAVAKMVWPELEWTGDLSQDKKIAEQPFYRHFTYRYMAKRGGHGTNYYGKPPTMSRHLKISTHLMEEFQERYFGQFPGIRQWQFSVMQRLQQEGTITTPFGRFRRFFGRPTDDATVRKAIAHEPQSLISDVLNTGLWRIWKYMPEVQVLAQVHDAVLFQYPEELEDDILPRAIQLIQIPISIGPRTMIIPSEAKIGWNWGDFDEHSNFAGLKKWSGNDDRTRPEPTTILDARVA